MTAPSFDTTVQGAIALLRELPRGATDQRRAKDAFAQFRERHAAADPLLVVDHAPGARELDFDVLLRDPSGASLALALRPDGNPWAAHYADHWDAPWVVSAGDTFLSIQWALTSFHWMSRDDPGYRAQLEEDVIVCHRLEAQRFDIPDDAMQEAVDDFRGFHGLEEESRMRAWLVQMGMTEDRFFALLRGALEARLVRDEVTRDGIEPYFAAHPAAFDRTVVARVECADAAAATEVAGLARSRGLGDFRALEIAALPIREMSVERGFAHTLPEPLRGGTVGAVHVSEGAAPVVRQLLARSAARLDDDTRRAVRAAVFQEWISAERARIAVRWYGV